MTLTACHLDGNLEHTAEPRICIKQLGVYVADCLYEWRNKNKDALMSCACFMT